MAEQKNTIKLNGKLYDAKTGAAIGHVPAKKPATKPTPAKSTVTPKKSAHPKTTHAHTIHDAKTVHARKQRAHTLMRSAVKRPIPVHKTPISAPLDSNSVVRVIEPEPLMQSGEYSKATRHTTHIKKSGLITRFGTFVSSPAYVTKSEALDVRPAPKEAASHLGHQAVYADVTPDFTKAIHQATSHTQSAPAHTKRRHRAAKKIGVSNRAFNAGAISLVLLLIVGFMMYQNKSGSEFRSASAVAGVHASLPSYIPPGFGQAGPVQYAPGLVTVRYESHSDGRNYSLSQQTSNWDDDALYANLSTANQRDVSSLQANEKTVYIYGGSNAAWVKSGILYQIEGDSTLSTDQLIKIANSL